MTPEERERLGDVLIEEGIITREEMQGLSAAIQGTALAAALDTSHYPRRAELAAWLAADFRMPLIDDLRKVELNPRLADVVPADVARKHLSLPLARMDGILVVARGGLHNHAAIQELRKATGLKVKILVADEAQVIAAIEWMYGNRDSQIPEPKSGRRAEPARVEESVAEAMPLISMDGGNGHGSDADVIEEILAATKVSRDEFNSEEKLPFARLMTTWDSLFLGNKPVNPTRIS